MTHWFRDSDPACGADLSPDDDAVLIAHAFDPNILEVDCPYCSAVILKELHALGE